VTVQPPAGGTRAGRLRRGWPAATPASSCPTPVLGLPIYAGTPATATDVIVRAAREGSGGYACFCNVHLMVTAQRDQEVMRALTESSMVFPDGAPIAWLLRRHGHPAASRVCGPEMMERVLAVSASGHRLRHYLLGSTPQVLDTLTNVLGRRYPRLEIAGRMSPGVAGLHDIDREISVRAINATRPDIVWCALGAPKQELWMLRNADQLHPAVVLGVGAAFDFLAGTLPRAPVWMQHHGLEWAYRAATEPRRLLPRYLSTNSRFLCYVAHEALARRKAPSLGSDG
jgi:N-acetylglucosaminyldiphosphoundecaprenol N-acetyl-beta-D-mannosaminyltransferase